MTAFSHLLAPLPYYGASEGTIITSAHGHNAKIIYANLPEI